MHPVDTSSRRRLPTLPAGLACLSSLRLSLGLFLGLCLAPLPPLMAGEIIIDTGPPGQKPVVVVPGAAAETPDEVLANPRARLDALRDNTAKAQSYMTPSGGGAPPTVVIVPGSGEAPGTPQQINHDALRANTAKAQSYIAPGGPAAAPGPVIVVTPDGQVQPLTLPQTPAAAALTNNRLKAESFSAGKEGVVPTTTVIILPPGETGAAVEGKLPAEDNLEHNLDRARAWSQGQPGAPGRTGCSNATVAVGRIGDQPVVVDRGGLNASSVLVEGGSRTGNCQ